MPLENKEKRYSELNQIVKEFSNELNIRLEGSGVVVNITNDKIKKIVDNYEIILDEVIKDYLNEGSYAQIFKVVSGMELATLYTQPINTLNPIRDAKLNASLSIFIAQAYILQYENVDCSLDSVKSNDQLKNLMKNHKTLLEYLSITEYYLLPVFSTAIFWEAFTYIVKGADSQFEFF